jgi:hypothetical protein
MARVSANCVRRGAIIQCALALFARLPSMKLRTVIGTAAASLLLLAGGASSAMGGEINGKGQPPGGEGLGAAHANSICAFSGLEDGDGAGFPGPGGAPPQNWGHSKEFFGATPAERKASGFQPGDSCNGHSGFLVNPPPEEP